MIASSEKNPANGVCRPPRETRARRWRRDRAGAQAAVVAMFTSSSMAYITEPAPRNSPASVKKLWVGPGTIATAHRPARGACGEHHVADLAHRGRGEGPSRCRLAQPDDRAEQNTERDRANDDDIKPRAGREVEQRSGPGRSGRTPGERSWSRRGPGVKNWGGLFDGVAGSHDWSRTCAGRTVCGEQQEQADGVEAAAFAEQRSGR